MAMMDVTVPDIGDFDEVAVIEMLVKVGDSVKAEQSLITVESDKASMEIPCSHAGVVKELKVKLGDKVKQGSVVVVLEVAGAYSGAPSPVAAPAAPVDLQLAQGVPPNIQELLAMVHEDDSMDMPLQAAVKQNEHSLIRAALESSRSRLEAAEKLGISPRTLRYKLARLRDNSLSQLANA